LPWKEAARRLEVEHAQIINGGPALAMAAASSSPSA
jgi:hypothetical protein